MSCILSGLPRLQKVVDGEQGGISKAIQWQGGGGFKFYELAPTLITKDGYGNPILNTEKYDSIMLSAAIAKLNGFVFKPDTDIFWKQGQAQDNSFILSQQSILQQHSWMASHVTCWSTKICLFVLLPSIMGWANATTTLTCGRFRNPYSRSANTAWIIMT